MKSNTFFVETVDMHNISSDKITLRLSPEQAQDIVDILRSKLLQAKQDKRRGELFLHLYGKLAND